MRPLHAVRLLALLALATIANAETTTQPADPITGDVVTAEGKPAPGATVALQGNTNGDYNSPFAQIATADADGKFVISPRPGVRDAFALIPAVAISAPARPLKSPAHFTLLPAVDVELTFLAPDGKPAAALNVSPKHILFRSDGESFPLFLSLTDDLATRFSAKTDDAGKCTIHGLPRATQVLFEIDDPRYAHLDFTNAVMLEGEGNLIHARPITLTAAATISGTLLNPETHAPMPGLRVGAQSHDTARPGGASALTDAQGNFTIARLPGSSYVLTLYNPDDNSTPFVAAAINVKVADGQHAIANLTLERGGTLQGIVRDASTGKGIPNMDVGLYGAARPRQAAGIESRNTDANGRFSFHVPAGEQYPYLAMEVPDGYLEPAKQGMQTITVPAGQTVEVNFDLKPNPNPVIEGRVLDPDGKPAPHAFLQLPSDESSPDGRTITADDNGHFRFHAKPGTKMTASLGDFSTPIPEVASADGPMEIQLEKQARFTLLVKIADPAGNPVPGASAELITVTGQFGSSGQPHHADAAGIVRFESLRTDGKYDVNAQADGYGATQKKVGPPPFDEPRELELHITLRKATEEISGRVLDKDNKPVPNAHVELNGITVLRTTTDADGKFLFHVAKRTSGVLYLRQNDGNTLNPSTARAGDKDLELHNYKDANPATHDPLP